MQIHKRIIEDEIEKGIPLTRPPNLWNKPDSLKEKHVLRFSSNLFKENTDPRALELYKTIQNYAEQIKVHQTEEWNFLVDKIIDSYSGEI